MIDIPEERTSVKLTFLGRRRIRLTTVAVAVAAAVLGAGAYTAHADNSGDVRDQNVQRKPAEPTYTLPYEPPNPMPATQERDGIQPMDTCGHCVLPESQERD